jgi:hypothetical protein
MAKVTVYQILVNGIVKETAGTWSQAEKSLNNYKKSCKNTDIISYKEIQK